METISQHLQMVHSQRLVVVSQMLSMPATPLLEEGFIIQPVAYIAQLGVDIQISPVDLARNQQTHKVLTRKREGLH